MSGKRPDDWTVEKLEQMADMADKMATHISGVVRSMKDEGVDTIALQARKKWLGLHDLLTWSEFDLKKAFRRQAAMRAKASTVAEGSKKSRRK